MSPRARIATEPARAGAFLSVIAAALLICPVWAGTYEAPLDACKDGEVKFMTPPRAEVAGAEGGKP